MMYEGKHIHYSPVDNRPLCSYSGKLCRQRRVNGYAFCIRHILEDKTAPFKQCAHAAKYNNQKCTNPIPSNEDREFCNSHMQVAGMAPKKERKNKREREIVSNIGNGKLKFADRVKVLLKGDGDLSPENVDCSDDPYTFSDVLPEYKDIKQFSNLSASKMAAKSPDNRQESVPEQCIKLESPKSNAVFEKNKGNPTRSSKTVNRLEAKIARNKILDKQKKNRPQGGANPSTKLDFGLTVPEEISINTGQTENSSKSSLHIEVASALSPACTSTNSADFPPSEARSSFTSTSKPMECDALSARTAPTSFSIFPNKMERRWTWRKPELISNSVKKVQRLCENKKDFQADLFPLGFEGAESENEDSDSEIYQRHWLASPSDQDSWVDEQHGVLLRPMKLNLGASELRRQCSQLQHAQLVSVPARRAQCSLVQAMISASKIQPLQTTRLLSTVKSCCKKNVKKRTKHVAVNRQKCCYSNEDAKCLQIALPFTRHCAKHIMYNVDQLLFEHCTAKFADNTQCCIPVFDICHELPLCEEHARKKDNYSKMSAEPKPKKPRKKTKSSSLSRSSKRGKKKKRQAMPRMSMCDVTNLSQSSTSQELSSSMNFDMDSPEMSPGTPVLDDNDVTEVEDQLNGPMDSDLGSLSPDSIDKSLVLPIDAAELANQASRLLEEHDFTEVLNKIPDDAFRDLFNESKNGAHSPSKEETEELERALAAVDKDVKSLVKYSNESHLDIHESLLHNDNLGSTLDNSLSDFSGSGIGMDNLHVITSSLTSSDLNSLTQVLSSITSDGSLAHLPVLSDIVSSTGHHSSDVLAGGFSVGSHALLSGRGDATHCNLDQFVCDPLDTSHAYWLNEQLSIPVSHNGLLSPHSYGHSTSKFVPHSLNNMSKLEAKGRNHLNNFNTSLLENSLSMTPLVMELTDNSTESVS